MEISEIKKLALTGLKVVETRKTAPYEGGPETETELTIIFDGLTVGDVIDYAVNSIIIKRQGKYRREAMRKENAVPIPKKDTYEVPKIGTRATGEVSTEKAVKTILRKAGGDVSKAMEMLKAMAGQE